jgi:hypothetical protein
MSPKNKQNSALGRGLDALISKKHVKESKTESESAATGKEIDKKIAKDKALNLNNEIVEEIIAEIKKNPRISLWSAKSAAVLRYLRKTEPEFSISSEASILIENAVKKKYPEIWELFEKHI